MNFKVNETATKLRGGYYTPINLAAFLTRWVLAKKPNDLLEPSCGDGAFVEALAVVGASSVKTLTAFDIEASETAKARRKAKKISGLQSRVHTGDFLAWSLDNYDTERFDAAVGNPPFIRYQYLSETMQANAERIFKHFNLPFTKHTNAWVSFVISSLAMLRPEGRFAMVLPAEILHVLHAQSLRTFFCSQCSRIMIFDPQELWFDGALQGAVLVLAEKKAMPTDRCYGVSICQTKSNAFLSDDPDAYFSSAEYVNGETVVGKWMKALLTHSERELLQSVVSNKDVFSFKQLAHVDVGIVTGANKFFLVSDDVVDKFGLGQWARPMFGRSEHVPGVIYDQKTHKTNKKIGLPANFICFPNDVQFADLPEKVQQYILSGEAEKLHERYKCGSRTPWFSVPSVYTTPVAMLKRSHHFHRLILNSAEAYTTDTAYRIELQNVDGKRLVYSFINSLTALSAELEGRHYGGGVLELVPSEIEKLLIPLPQSVIVDLKGLDKAVRTTSTPEAIMSEQDAKILTALGLKKSEQSELLTAWLNLKRRRLRSEE
ncbi:MAG: N-6 DNA methylase [Trichlorobacter sp.]